MVYFNILYVWYCVYIDRAKLGERATHTTVCWVDKDPFLAVQKNAADLRVSATRIASLRCIFQ